MAPFLPSRHGCSFSNQSMPGLHIRLGPLPLGRVPNGLCGGMVLHALRRWRANQPRPGVSRQDLAAILLAQIRSFDLPAGPLRYWHLQQPGSRRARAAAVRSTMTQLREHCARGIPVPLGLVNALGRGPATLVRHHVVLAYAIDEDAGDALAVAVYDPNFPGRDDIRLWLHRDRRPHTSHGAVPHGVFALRAR